MYASSNDSDRYLLRLNGMKRPVTTLIIFATAFVCLLILVLAGAFISVSRTAFVNSSQPEISLCKSMYDLKELIRSLQPAIDATGKLAERF